MLKYQSIGSGNKGIVRNMITKKGIQSLLALILMAVCYCILRDANWLFMGSMPGDDYQFLMTTAIGKASHGSTWSSRFWPLGLSDYSVLLLFGSIGRTAFAHYVWNCITLVISCGLMFKLAQNSSKNPLASFISLLFIFVSSGFAQINMECIYSERMIAFAICIFRFSVEKTQKSKNIVWYALGLIFAIYSIYMKELVFVIFLLFASMQLFFNELSKKDKIFYIALILNCILFISIYTYRRIFKPQDEAYTTVLASLSDVSFAQFFNEPILFFLFILCLIRAYAVLINHDRKSFCADAFLFAAMAYAFCYFLLKLHAGYYLFPAVVLSVPAFANFLDRSRFCLVLGFCALMICGYLNLGFNKYIVMNDWEHRKSDHKIFENIVAQSKKGISVYWLSDIADKEKEHKYWHYDRIMCLNRFQHFLKYYNFNETFPINQVFEPSAFLKNSIVIINERTLARESFKKNYEKFISIFSPKEIARIGENVIYKI